MTVNANVPKQFLDWGVARAWLAPDGTYSMGQWHEQITTGDVKGYDHFQHGFVRIYVDTTREVSLQYHDDSPLTPAQYAALVSLTMATNVGHVVASKFVNWKWSTRFALPEAVTPEAEAVRKGIARRELAKLTIK